MDDFHLAACAVYSLQGDAATYYAEQEFMDLKVSRKLESLEEELARRG